MCYCLHCIAAVHEGYTEWNGKSHEIVGCCMTSLGMENETNVYKFDRSHCERTHGPNVTNQLQEEKRSRAEMATALNIGDWVLFDSKMEDEPICLGRVMSNPVPEESGPMIMVSRLA